MSSLLRRLLPSSTGIPTSTKSKDAVAAHPAGSHSSPRDDPTRPLSLMNLPPEIHLLISDQLIYPDALSLRHVNRHFYYLVDTGVKLKIDWLVERRRLHLECPNNQRCDLGSDLRFCRGSVRLLMERRREHIECESRPGLGCLIYGTSTCPQRRKLGSRLKRWLHIRLTFEMWWLLLALVPIVLCWVWKAEALL
ncbi:hypothetical protein BR93DRAFT_924231 [Coniochaeta sp. PMI_546]|nr:hypothetical protein BR93DRAFT_924231 [Coniochaeta sp. PMI_546]